MEPSEKVKQQIQEEIRKLIADMGYVAPEIFNAKLAQKLAVFAGHVWNAAIEETRQVVSAA